MSNLEFTIENEVLKSYNGTNKNITIPKNIKRIGKNAFKGKMISSIKFEDNSLRSIDENAFRDCSILQSIIIPDGVAQIGDYAFYGCLGLKYISIPSSLIVVGEDILGACKNTLLVIGKENTEAEKIAKQYNLALKPDVPQTIIAAKNANYSKSRIQTKTFDIFGEKIEVSNSIAKYNNNFEYYSNRKEPFFNSFFDNLPIGINGKMGDLPALINAEDKKLIDRLSKQGIFITPESLSTYKIEPYKAIINVANTILEAQKDINEAVLHDLQNANETLINEAESKITGLSYGILGDGISLLTYAIDDYKAQVRQRQKAYAEKETKFNQIRNDYITKANQIYSDLIIKCIPIIHGITDSYIDTLFKAENDFLEKEYLIDSEIEENIDIQKSNQIISSIENTYGDNSFSVALALKKYPCNINAFVYAKEKGYSCRGLTSLINFLGIEEEIKNARVSKIKDLINNTSNANDIVKLTHSISDILSEKEMSLILLDLRNKITQSVKEIPEASDNANKEFLCKKLSDMLNKSTWDYFQSYLVTPVNLSVNSYEELEDWVCDQANKNYEAKREYEEYLNKYPILKRKEEIEKNYKNEINTSSASDFGFSIMVISSIIIIIFGIFGFKDVGISVVFCVIGIILGLISIYHYNDSGKDFKNAKHEFIKLKNTPSFEEYKKTKGLEGCRPITAKKTEERRIAKEKAVKKCKKIAIITTPIVAFCIVFIIILNTVIIPNIKYNNAVDFYNVKKYEDAYKAFSSFNYKDSADKAAECLFLKQKAGLTNVKVGSTIKFGYYEQDNNNSNGKEEIEWKVLAIEGNKAFVISQYALDRQKYNNTLTDTTWEKCSLRTWLNETFYNTAFSADHQKMIANSTVTADKNPEYSTSPGNNTTDKVFFLSISEANKYFSSDSARQCKGTVYCYAQGAYKASNGNCWWWLRSPGLNSSTATIVHNDGFLFDSGNHVHNINIAVRPAMWIKVK